MVAGHTTPMTVSSEPFPPVEAMITLLTVEGLLLASLSIALVLFVIPGFSAQIAWRLIVALTILIAIAAIGAGAAWCEQFLGPWPDSLGGKAPIICIAIGIAFQPVVAIIVSILTRPKRVGNG